jgi:P27 family predicted phage terminase small subunit
MLKLHGSRVIERRRNEPKPTEGKPTKPKWLTGEGAKVWKQVIAQMDDMGVLTKADGSAIARYCELLVRWISNAEFLRRNGEIYPLKDDAGKIKCFQQFPQVSIVNKLSVLILRLEQEFGLTPSSRATLQVTPQSKASPVASRARNA